MTDKWAEGRDASGRIDRRTVLATVGTGSIASLAGCQGRIEDVIERFRDGDTPAETVTANAAHSEP